jgi:hypothetical protein
MEVSEETTNYTKGDELHEEEDAVGTLQGSSAWCMTVLAAFLRPEGLSDVSPSGRRRPRRL